MADVGEQKRVAMIDLVSFGDNPVMKNITCA
jgi:hypothetical protein